MILFRSKLVQEKYCPPLICLSPAMQFYVRTKYEKPPPIQIVKETLKLSDGGIVAFDHFANNKGTFPSGFVSLKTIRIKIVFM